MKHDPSFRARSRAHSLLLSAQGTTIKDIAKTYQVHRVTVSAWMTHWEHHGAQSLHDQPRSGRPTLLPPAEQDSALHYMKETCFAQRSRGALRRHNGQAPQGVVAETSG